MLCEMSASGLKKKTYFFCQNSDLERIILPYVYTEVDEIQTEVDIPKIVRNTEG